MSERCVSCRFYVPNRQETTLMQEWERDTRPERPMGIIGALRWVWHPAQFRAPRPDDEIGQYVDRLIVEKNNSGRCVRRASSVKVSPNYWCGEYQPNPHQKGE